MTLMKKENDVGKFLNKNRYSNEGDHTSGNYRESTKQDQLQSLTIPSVLPNSDLETSVTDVSENRTIIRISGEKLFTLLSKFLVLDLEKNLSNQLSCAQTLFVKVPILIVRNNKNDQIPEIDIFTNRSHAMYVYELLVDGTKNQNG